MITRASEDDLRKLANSLFGILRKEFDARFEAEESMYRVLTMRQDADAADRAVLAGHIATQLRALQATVETIQSGLIEEGAKLSSLAGQVRLMRADLLALTARVEASRVRYDERMNKVLGLVANLESRP